MFHKMMVFKKDKKDFFQQKLNEFTWGWKQLLTLSYVIVNQMFTSSYEIPISRFTFTLTNQPILCLCKQLIDIISMRWPL